MKLFVATSNPGKLRDFAFAAGAFPGVEILPLPGLGRIAPPEETGDTFAGNALIKALAYGELAPEEIVVADDSGIAVRGLGGAPGVRSARYAEDEGFFIPGQPGASVDARNNACLLDRAAKLRYRDVSYLCTLAAVRGGELLATATGELQGRLALEPHGEDGFGYDPIFEVLELNRTMAQIEPEVRLRLSHRGRALAGLVRALSGVLCPLFVVRCSLTALPAESTCPDGPENLTMRTNNGQRTTENGERFHRSSNIARICR